LAGVLSRMGWSLEVARCLTTALILEAAVHPKPGLADRVNHLGELNIFRLSASAVSFYPFFLEAAKAGMRGRVEGSLGRLVYQAACGMLKAQAGGNTHLGAILLCIPLAAAAGSLGTGPADPSALRASAKRILGRLSWRDATDVFRAIRLARPGGLGRVPFLDVEVDETYLFIRRGRIGLIEALEPYRGRDMVADELIDCYPLVFDVGLRAILEWERRTNGIEGAAVNALLAILSSRPDTHVARRRGIQVARIIQSMASEVLRLGGVTRREGLEALRELDAYLRRVDARPGSSADILAASLAAHLLMGASI